MPDADAVPCFPFTLLPEGKGWLLQDPIRGGSYELNAAARQLLGLCDGYRTWGEIASELGRAHGLKGDEVEALAAGLLGELADAGLLWWRRQRMHAWRLGPPASVLWDLTYRCNLACRHCVVSAGPARPAEAEELTLEQCCRVIDELAAFGVACLILSGGEPFLRPDFFEIAEHAGRRGLHIQAATNGTLIDERAARRLAAIGNVEAQLSLDGATPEVHDGFRQVPGTWERAVRGVRHLVAAGVPVMLAAAVTKANLAQIPALYRLACELGVERFRILPFVPFGRGGSARELEVSPQEMREVTAFLRGRREEGGLPVAPMEFECTFAPPPASGAEPETRIGCDGAVSYCTITAGGDVLPCNFFAGAEALNVREQSFAWIWENSRFLNYFRSLTVADIRGSCRKCDWVAECRGSCIAANFAHGDVFQANVHCWLVDGGRAAEPGADGRARG